MLLLAGSASSSILEDDRNTGREGRYRDQFALWPYKKFDVHFLVAAAEYLRKVMLELRRELPPDANAQLLSAVKNYLHEPSDRVSSRERHFANALQTLVDKYQVHLSSCKVLAQSYVTWGDLIS